MKAFKILIVLLSMLIIFGCSSNKGSENEKAGGKSKANTKQAAFLMDETQLENPEYAAQLQVIALASLAKSALYIGKKDFSSIYEAFGFANDDLAWSKETGLQALGLRQDVVKSRAEATAAGAGNAGSEGSDVSTDMQQMIDAKLQAGVKLSESQKQYFLVSLTRLGAAIAKEVILVKSATDYVNDVKAMAPMQKAKEAKNLPKAADMVSKLPGNIASQLKTLKIYIDIAKTNNVKIPDDVTKLI
jgi:hypothetical protein